MTAGTVARLPEQREDDEAARWIRLAELIRDDPRILAWLADKHEQQYREVIDGLRTLSITVKAEAWRDPRPGRGGRPEQLVPGTPGSFSDRLDWVLWLLNGGRGCVAAGTIIDDPFGGIGTPVEDWCGGWVAAVNDEGLMVPAFAGRSFLKGRAPLFRVTTARGDEIVVTGQHRFLTPLGWVRLADIDVGDVIGSHQSRPGPTTSTEDGQRSTRKAEDSPAGCRRLPRSRDRQLRQEPGPFPGVTRRQVDALAHIQIGSREGGWRASPGRNRPDRQSDRPARNSSDPVEPYDRAAGSRSVPSNVEPIQLRDRTRRLSPPYSGPDHEEQESGHGLAERLAVEPRSVSLRPAALAPRAGRAVAESSEEHTRTAQREHSSAHPADTAQRPLPARPLPSSSVYHTHSIVAAIEPLGEGDFYDLTVNGYENYSANRIINHNSGKSRTGAEGTRELLDGHDWIDAPVWGLVGQTLDAVRVQMVENTLLKIIPEAAVEKWNRGPCELWLRNGAFLKGFSSEAPRKILGYNLSGAWADEMASWTDADRSPAAPHTTWSNLALAVRGHDRHTWVPRIIGTTTPKAVRLIRNPDPADPENPGPGLYDAPGTVVSNMSTLANIDNLPQHFVDNVIAPLEGTRLYDQEIEGKLVDAALGAQWSPELVARMMRSPGWPDGQAGGIVRVAIGVDPSTGEGLGDECGIVVVGLCVDGRAYVLADLSKRCPPKEWVGIIAKAYLDFDADAVVCEKNAGGALLRETLSRYAPNLPLVYVTAKKGKVLRAEPVALLSDQDRVRFAGNQARLIYQMTTWVDDGKKDSPDRLDAFVYAVLWLLPPFGLSDLISTSRHRTRR